MPSTIYKPPGLTVFEPHNEPGGDCVFKRLLADEPWRAEIDWPVGFAGGIAHRLDVPTSGALLVADSLDELAAIRKMFAKHQFTKTYYMLSAAKVNWNHNTAAQPIAHDRKRKGKMIVQRGQNTPHRGKWYPAETKFERIKGQLFRVEMRTGITHQIRAHAAFIGIPILGDKKYGGADLPHNTPEGITFYLHHAGLAGKGNVRTHHVPIPLWVEQ